MRRKPRNVKRNPRARSCWDQPPQATPLAEIRRLTDTAAAAGDIERTAAGLAAEVEAMGLSPEQMLRAALLLDEPSYPRVRGPERPPPPLEGEGR